MLRILYILFLVVCTTSCVEWFDPEIETQDSLLVVEGLLSNREGGHYVKLSMSQSYSQGYELHPVQFAIVYLKDQNDFRISYSETKPGHYYSSANFAGEVGNTYTLHIETREGEVFVSEPQIMMPSVVVDSLQTFFEYRDVLTQGTDGSFQTNRIEGYGLYADVDSNDENPPMVRFETVLMVQYVLSEYKLNPMHDPTIFYGRLKQVIDETVNITEPELGVDVGSSLYHNVGFVRSGFSIETVDTLFIREINRRIVILRQHTLNKESYQFYKQLKKQIDADGTLFDPMPTQITGNIKCVSNPEKRVLGLFEASSYHSETFLFSLEPLGPNNLSIWRIHDLDHVPDHELYKERTPDYWILL